MEFWSSCFVELTAELAEGGAGHLSAAVWVRPLQCSPFGRWDVWALKTFRRRRLGAVLRYCR